MDGVGVAGHYSSPQDSGWDGGALLLARKWNDVVVLRSTVHLNKSAVLSSCRGGRMSSPPTRKLHFVNDPPSPDHPRPSPRTILPDAPHSIMVVCCRWGGMCQGNFVVGWVELGGFSTRFVGDGGWFFLA